MIAYLFNFTLCSGLLLLAYRLFLQGERMYRFNRFYLLFSLVFALAVPAISIHMPFQSTSLYHAEYTIELPGGIPVQAQAVQAAPIAQVAAPPPAYNYLPLILALLYIPVFAVMLYRFARNLYRISRVVKAGEVIGHQQSNVILTAANVTPHSFLNYIFINRDDYRDGSVEPEIICHEETHIRQRHSLDVLFVEVLQVVFWFNPFIPFYRRCIQLNHEFLADEAVVQLYHDTPSYQSLLLVKACQSNSLRLTSPFNYQSTKKRLIMMTKTTSAKIALIKQIALIPVLAIALFLFCNAVTAQSKQPTQEVKIDEPRLPAAKKDAPQSAIDEYHKTLMKYVFNPKQKGLKYISYTSFTRTDKARLITLYKQMSPAQQAKQDYKFIPRIPPMPKIQPTQQQLDTWKKDKECRIWIDGQHYQSDKQANFKSGDYDRYEVKTLTDKSDLREGYKYEAFLMPKKEYAKYIAAYKADTSTVQFMLQTPPKPKITEIRFPPPVVKPDANAPKPKVDQVRFPPPVTRTLTDPLIVINNKRTDQKVPEGFPVGRATKAQYAGLIGVDSTAIAGTFLADGPSAVKRWGADAKRGVLFIYTKKPKKQ